MTNVVSRARMGLRVATVLGVALAFLWTHNADSAESRASIAAVTPAELGAWEARLRQLIRGGELRLRKGEQDTLLPERRHERFAQLHRGVPVFGGEAVLQTDGAGLALSIFGDLHEGISIDVHADLTRAQALARLGELGAVPFDDDSAPELVVLPRGSGMFTLAYRARVLREGDLRMLFLDAHNGRLIFEYGDLKTQAVGIGTGLLGDRKKVSSTDTPAGFVALDGLRTPPVQTFDLRGDAQRFLGWLAGRSAITPADMAIDEDNVWTDGRIVDAHVYAGYLLDYLYKRFGYRSPKRLVSLTNLVRLEDVERAPRYLYCYAAYWGNGVVAFGEGLPPGWTTRTGSLPLDQQCGNLAAALDLVAHEYAHGVIQYSSNLIYAGESGALNEAFCDIVGTGAEFFFQEPGAGPMRADYLFAEDAVQPGGARSLADPASYGDPDHYTTRYRGQGDNGGIHTNSNVAGHAFYLAVEGGANRTSGLSVQGVGAANREQIERAFFRAFVYLLPADASFALAGVATLQSARDLYGADSPAARAIAQGWAAVGVY
ncbi:MAG: M4 family metallopeptidase [Vicinamibacteria bacterium]